MCKNSGGIYVILNLIDCKAYVGQAKNFSNRTHTLELYGGNDNNKALQTDYMNDDLELIYFVIGRYVGKYINDYDKHTFDRYEKLFMTLMEDLGFSLYNRNIKREDRTFEKLKFSEKDYDDALKELKNDFIIRFNMDPDYLSRASIPVRQQALDFYADKRLKSSNASSTSSDVNFGKNEWFLFKKTRMSKIFNNTIQVDINTLDIDEMFYSKAGSYIGEGIDQILSKKVKTITNFKYCLWAFANNAVSANTVRKYCRKRFLDGKDTYVLFHFTYSSKYSDHQENKFLQLKKNSSRELTADECAFLGLLENDSLPEGVNCTAVNTSNVNAFVIQEFIALKDIVNGEELKNQYGAVNRIGGIYEIGNCKQRSTFYVRLKDGQQKVNYENLCTGAKHRTICFAARLAAPYIVTLTKSQEQEARIQ